MNLLKSYFRIHFQHEFNLHKPWEANKFTLRGKKKSLYRLAGKMRMYKAYHWLHRHLFYTGCSMLGLKKLCPEKKKLTKRSVCLNSLITVGLKISHPQILTLEK